MSIITSLIGGIILLGVFLGSLFNKDRRSTCDAACMLRDIEKGHCPRCNSEHPEASKHVGDHGFWTTFRCPECSYSATAHVRRAGIDIADIG